MPTPPSTPPSPEQTFRLEQAQRAIDHQLSSVDAAQSRAGFILAGLSLTASLLAERAATAADGSVLREALFWAGLGAVVAAGALLVFAAWPRAYEVSVDLVDNESAAQMAHRVAGTIRNEFLARNEPKRIACWAALRAGLIMFIIHALCWGALHILEAK